MAAPIVFTLDSDYGVIVYNNYNTQTQLEWYVHNAVNNNLVADHNNTQGWTHQSDETTITLTPPSGVNGVFNFDQYDEGINNGDGTYTVSRRYLNSPFTLYTPTEWTVEVIPNEEVTQVGESVTGEWSVRLNGSVVGSLAAKNGWDINYINGLLYIDYPHSFNNHITPSTNYDAEYIVGQSNMDGGGYERKVLTGTINVEDYQISVYRPVPEFNPAVGSGFFCTLSWVLGYMYRSHPVLGNPENYKEPYRGYRIYKNGVRVYEVQSKYDSTLNDYIPVDPTWTDNTCEPGVPVTYSISGFTLSSITG